MNWGVINGIVTLVLMLVFIGIWIWAWRGKRKKDFDEAARLPLQDDERPDDAERDKHKAD